MLILKCDQCSKSVYHEEDVIILRGVLAEKNPKKEMHCAQSEYDIKHFCSSPCFWKWIYKSLPSKEVIKHYVEGIRKGFDHSPISLNDKFEK